MQDIVKLPHDKKDTDLLLLALLNAGEYTLFPELYAIFGPKVYDFIDRFGGMTIVVPHRTALSRALRRVNIYVDYKRAPDKCKDVALKYGLSMDKVRKIAKDMERQQQQSHQIVANMMLGDLYFWYLTR
jgi:hypothetical protein